MKNNRLMIIGLTIIIVLLAAFIILLFVNRGEENIPENSFMIIYADQKKIISMEDMNSLGEEEFSNWHRNSQGANELKNYTGVEFKRIIEYYEISLEGAKSITFIASDGFARIYSIEEVLSDNNVFIATKSEGELFIVGISGSGQDDGGPFVVIKRSDYYSMNRVKKFIKAVINYD